MILNILFRETILNLPDIFEKNENNSINLDIAWVNHLTNTIRLLIDSISGPFNI